MKIVKTMIALAMALGLAACSDKDMETPVVEGLPATLTITVSAPKPEEVAVTRATAAENTVENMMLLFYKKSQPDEAPVVVEISDLTQAATTTSGSDATYQYTISTTEDDGLESGYWYVYAIANYNKQFCTVDVSKFKTMTKAQMDAYVTGGSTDQDFVETSVLMSGKYAANSGLLTLQPGANKIADLGIALRRLVSKSTFTFKAEGSGITFTPTSYILHNASRSSTLMERDGWTSKSDAYATDPGSMTYAGASDGIIAETDEIQISSDDGSFYFYTQENAQPSNSGVTAYTGREAHVSASDQSFANAPENATYVEVKGTYTGPGINETGGTITAYVTYYIHLGDFSTASGSMGNFSVRRNTKYNYTVTVKGVNKIYAEVKASSFTEEQPGAEGRLVETDESANDVIVDSHYEQVLLAIELPNSGISAYHLCLSTPYTNKVYDNLGHPATDDDYKWIEFGKPASTSTFQSYTTLKSSNKLCYIDDLMDALKGTLSTSNDYYYYPGSGNTVYVAAYVNEFYYDGKPQTDFVNASNRSMMLAEAAEISKDNRSFYAHKPIIRIQQKSIKSPFKVADDKNFFGVETYEETDSVTTISGTFSESDKLNGWANYEPEVVGKNWSDYVQESTNGYINGKHGTAMKSSVSPYYDVLSRNRDLDGDGVIDEDEVRWYLPASNQYFYLWFGASALPKDARMNNTCYFTSTSGSRIYWAKEGTALGNSLYDNYGTVRAVRNLKTYNAAPDDIKSYDTSTRTVTISGLRDACTRSSHMVGDYVAHNTGETADKLPEAFVLASSRLTSSTYTTAQIKAGNISAVTSYTEESDGSDKGYWRIPNEKELAMMLLCLESMDNYTVAITYYLGNSNVYWTYENGISTGSGTKSGFYIRPVRDVK